MNSQMLSIYNAFHAALSSLTSQELVSLTREPFEQLRDERQNKS